MMLREENRVQEVGPVGAADCFARDEYTGNDNRTAPGK